MRKVRIDRGLLQREAALQVGVDVTTLRLWEWGTHEPVIRHIPGIVRFLGYAPFPEPRSLGERLHLYRKLSGISREALARKLGVDPATLWRWESDRAQPGKRHRGRIEALLRDGAKHPELGTPPLSRAVTA